MSMKQARVPVDNTGVLTTSNFIHRRDKGSFTAIDPRAAATVTYCEVFRADRAGRDRDALTFA
jgi:hypothetical protein